ncbi:actin binding protein family [Artemisia annua]|uniref:Actin binding protein family n=1 Tax=Artemisia annua TaxID=35608 RepID=A0A2U1PA16_ARTAN|nr:actin binding protein family [Artemisia annua]
MGDDKRDISPLILKFGAALALSIGGVAYTMMINKRNKGSQSDCNKKVDSRGNNLQFDPLATDKHEELHHSNNSVIESPKGYSHEEEIKSLRNTIRILKERESNMEIELLEYYGLKEQETAVMELQNRLKLNNMEAKIYTLKIESLEAQMADYRKCLADLETARAKIKMLKRRLKSESEHNKKQILDIQQRVQKMQEDEHEREASLHKLKVLESEVEELRKFNHNLQLEKTDLAHKFDSAQILATSVLEDSESEKVREENQNLKKQNEDLSKEIEQLQTSRCADLEELVYLRWINACLRYELRNYQPGPGKATARDLSKTLSPKSEEKAKQLILEYANKEGGGEKGINVHEIDSDQWSNSQSSITDLGEFDESFIDDASSQKNNKFFGKLIRVFRGKESNNQRRKHSRSSSLGDDIISCVSFKHSIDLPPRRLTHRHSDSSSYKHIDSVGSSRRIGGSARRLSISSSCSKKSELAKYAEALEDSRAESNFTSHRSSPSLTFE